MKTKNKLTKLAVALQPVMPTQADKTREMIFKTIPYIYLLILVALIVWTVKNRKSRKQLIAGIVASVLFTVIAYLFLIFFDCGCKTVL